MRSDSALMCVSLALALAGCAGPSWEEIRAQDAPAGYRQFLADHPTSKYAPEARERLDILQFEKSPSLDALARFRRDHADSAALPDLLKRVEAGVFESARKEATPAAYAKFLETFPDGPLSARARGNQAYLQSGGFSGRPDLLGAFVREHPESDYAAEAQRVLSGLESRQHGGFARVSLEIDIDADVPEASRIRGVFAQRAHQIYEAAGIALVDAPGGSATLRIRHTERTVQALEGTDVLAKPGVLADTEVSLVGDDGRPIFQDRFGVRIPDADRRRSGSALFAKSADSYWDRFYVPVASWPTSAALRATWKATGPLAGIGADTARAIALASDGSFRELDLSDPTTPRVIGHYPRPAPAGRFGGARPIAGRVVLFGEDGIEIVARQGDAYRRVASYDRGAVGGIYGVEESNGSLLAAGTRGLMRVPFEQGQTERLIERPLRGIARAGATLYLLDDQWIYGGPIDDPRAPAFFTAADVGRPLEPRVLRVGGGYAVVVGERGIATFALAGTGTARALARPRTAGIGRVSDAVVLGGSLFALGERGLLVLDPRTGRILDSVDVDARTALGAAGGQLIAIGGDRLDVVDATPWIASGAASIAP